jgi:hypothetical protein
MASSLLGDIFNTFGITNSGLATSTLAPVSRTPSSEEIRTTDWDKNSAVDDPNVWQYYSNRMMMPRSLDEMMRLWDEMCNWDLMSAAMVEIVDETIQQDQGMGKSIWYECSNTKVEEDLNQMLEDLDVEEKLPSQIWHLAGYGNHFEKLLYEKGDGVQGLSYCHPMDVRRYWLSKNRRCVGFRWTKERPDKSQVWQQGDVNIDRAALSHAASGTTNNLEELWYPWDFMHLRRMYRLRISEHGEPIFEEAQGIYKKLRMAIDQMVVHRAQVQPDRYVVGIDTQEQPPLEQLKTVQRWKQSLRSKQAYGQGSGPNELASPTDFSSYYNPLALDTMFWLPRPKGFQHTIDKLAGTPNVPDVYDIELLLGLFFSIIGMPRSWLGGQNSESGGGPVSGKALLAQDIRFMRKVRSLRRPLIDGYTWLAYFHLIVKGVDIRDVDIKAKMSDIGTLEDQMRSEIFQSQVELLTKLGDFFEKYRIAPEAWLELIFKKYMHLPDELINTVLTALPAPVAMEGRGDAPAEYLLLRQLDEYLRPHRKLVEHLKRISKVLYEDVPISGHQSFKRHSQPTPLGMVAPRALFESRKGVSAGTVVCEILTEAHKDAPAAESTPGERPESVREFYRP